MSSLLSILSMLREFLQTNHSDELTCYRSLERSGIRSTLNVVIMQHIVHGEGVLADSTW
jgi:hypothetical protein